jgi:hypothetical protein
MTPIATHICAHKRETTTVKDLADILRVEGFDVNAIVEALEEGNYQILDVTECWCEYTSDEEYETAHEQWRADRWREEEWVRDQMLEELGEDEEVDEHELMERIQAVLAAAPEPPLRDDSPSEPCAWKMFDEIELFEKLRLIALLNFDETRFGDTYGSKVDAPNVRVDDSTAAGWIKLNKEEIATLLLRGWSTAEIVESLAMKGLDPADICAELQSFHSNLTARVRS